MSVFRLNIWARLKVNFSLLLIKHDDITMYEVLEPITVPARYKEWTVFARSNAGIVVSNSTQDMDVCVCVYSVFVLSCV
jgi:hypothetical protein